MDLISSIPGIGGAISYILPFLVILTIVVFIHEFGHFQVARWCGVRIEVFSVGFGKEIFGWYDRHGTRWKLSWIPLGGYVKFYGDASEASTPDRGSLDAMDASARSQSFHFKPLWARAAVVAAGPVANFLLTITIFATLNMAVGKFVAEARVGRVLDDSPAAAAGLLAGDRIVSIDGSDVSDFGDLQQTVLLGNGDPLRLAVERDGAMLDLLLTPEMVELDDGLGGKLHQPRIGVQAVGPDSPYANFHRFGPIEAVSSAVGDTWFILRSTVTYLGRVVTGRESADQVGGAITIAAMSGETARMGLQAFLTLAALLSASIGLINLFPVPMLDGGHLLFYAYEAVRGKPLGARAQEFGFKVGLMLVLSLMLFATWNDLVRFQVFDAFTGLFG